MDLEMGVKENNDSGTCHLTNYKKSTSCNWVYRADGTIERYKKSW